MTEGHDILFCDVCHDRQSFLISGSGKSGICLKCGNEIEPTIERRLKACMDFIFELLAPKSNVIDK